jgi:hypothetical protein
LVVFLLWRPLLRRRARDHIIQSGFSSDWAAQGSDELKESK